MLGRFAVGGFSVCLLASVLWAKQGVVTNRQQQTFTGDITEDDKSYFIKSAGGTLTIDKRNVAKVDYQATVQEQFDQRRSKLTGTDVKGRIELANWANQNQRADLALTVLEEARQIDPTNRDAAQAMDAIQQQIDLDKKGKNPAGAAPTTAAAGTPTPGPAVVKNTLERRLLNNDEINTIRQLEMLTDDPKVKVKFDNGVVKKYLSKGDRDAAAFNQLSAQAQALTILAGDPSLAKDVRIVTDPTPLMDFKTKVYPIIASSCGSTACHGGTKAGDFGLYPGESTPALYTNFFILQTYKTTINGTQYIAMDREVPTRSLVLQFGLPAAQGMPPHPKVTNWRARFKSDQDPAYQTVFDFMSNSVKTLQPDYGIAVMNKLPATQPASPATAVQGVKPAKTPATKTSR